MILVHLDGTARRPGGWISFLCAAFDWNNFNLRPLFFMKQLSHGKSNSTDREQIFQQTRSNDLHMHLQTSLFNCPPFELRK